MKLVVFGLTISSSWGNGHATTYRALLRAFAARGHQVVFYEWDAPWYSGNRDLARPGYVKLRLYDEWERVADLEKRSRAMFAQHAMRPDEVAQEVEAARSAIGSPPSGKACGRRSLP